MVGVVNALALQNVANVRMAGKELHVKLKIVQINAVGMVNAHLELMGNVIVNQVGMVPIVVVAMNA